MGHFFGTLITAAIISILLYAILRLIAERLPIVLYILAIALGIGSGIFTECWWAGLISAILLIGGFQKYVDGDKEYTITNGVWKEDNAHTGCFILPVIFLFIIIVKSCTS